ncbi:hypothetical protein DFH09DRAFT_167700 [Mycena vulgaris]|nr:hypothetical protein DFH09DRAFT_167700 [Mycena vulgaris]
MRGRAGTISCMCAYTAFGIALNSTVSMVGCSCCCAASVRSNKSVGAINKEEVSRNEGSEAQRPYEWIDRRRKLRGGGITRQSQNVPHASGALDGLVRVAAASGRHTKAKRASRARNRVGSALTNAPAKSPHSTQPQHNPATSRLNLPHEHD